MPDLPNFLEPKQWISHLFASHAARDGGVIRRKVRDVDRLVGRDAFLTEMERRGFTVIENAGQFIVLCNREPVRRLTGRRTPISSKKS